MDGEEFRSDFLQFDRNGAIMTPQERLEMCRRKGLCERCGRQTHEVRKLFFSKKPLTNENVWNGICLVCNPEKRPPGHRPPSRQAQGGRLPEQRRPAVVSTRRAVPDDPHDDSMNSSSQGFNGNDGPGAKGANSRLPNAVNRTVVLNTAIRREPRPANGDTNAGSLSSTGAAAAPPAALSTSAPNPPAPPVPRRNYLGGYTITGSGRKLRVDDTPTAPVNEQKQLDPEYVSSNNTAEGARNAVASIRNNPQDLNVIRAELSHLRNIGPNDAGGAADIVDAMKKHSRDTKLQTAACSALWSITADRDDLKVEAAEAGAITAVIESVENIPGDAGLVKMALGALSSLASGFGNRSAIVQSGGVNVIATGLKNHHHSVPVFEWACRALCALIYKSQLKDSEESTFADDKGIKESIAAIQASGAIPYIVRATLQHAEKHGVAVEWSLRLLLRLSVPCESNDGDDAGVEVANDSLRMIRTEDGFATCARIIDHRPTTEQIQEKAFELLCAIIDIALRESPNAVGSAIGMDSVVRTMREYPNNLVLQDMTCRVLSVLSSCKGDAEKRYGVGRSGLEAVISAMGNVSASVSLQESGCWVLWSASKSPALRNDAHAGQIVSSCVAALKTVIERNPHESTLVTAACHTLANFALCTESCDAPIGGMVQAMSEFESDGELQLSVCRAISNICHFDQSKCNMAFDEGGVDAIVRAMEAFPSDNDLQENACSALCVLLSSSNEKIRQCAIKSGGFRAIVGAMSKHSSNSALQLKALYAISMLTVSQGPETIPLDSAVIETVTAAMEAESDSLEFQVRGCLAIRNLASYAKMRNQPFAVKPAAKAILDAMQHHSNDIVLQKEACGALFGTLVHQFEAEDISMHTTFRLIVTVMDSNVGDDQRPFNAQIQEEALGALEYLTARGADAIRATPDDIDVVISVMYATLEQEVLNPDLIETALGVLLNLARDQSNENAIVQCGGIVAVIDAMQENEGEACVEENGCSILALVSSNNLEVKLGIAETDGIEVIISAMMHNPENRYLQTQACACLAHLSVDRESRDLITQQGGIMLIISAMTNLQNDAGLQEKACSALCNLASDAQEEVLRESHVVERVLESMRYHIDVPKVQERALGILQNLSMRNASTKTDIAALGGIDMIIASINENLRYPNVLERAFTTMWSLAVLDANQERIARADGIKLVIDGMMANISSCKVQKQACGCLCTLSSNANNKTRIRDLGGLDGIVFAMWAHFNSESLQTEACRALSSLALNAQNGEVTLATPSVIEAILTSMRMYPDSPRVQELACLALRNFSLSTTNISLLRERSDQVEELLSRAAERFPRQCLERANEVLSHVF